MKLSTSLVKRLSTWLKNNSLEAALVVLLIAYGGVVRYYPLEHAVPYEWEQGRDAWVMKQMLVDGKMPLAGPRVAINDFHLGPLYFYILSFFYSVTNLDPIGASYFVTTAYIFSALSLYFVGKSILGLFPGLIALYMHTISYFQTISDKPAWNVSLIIPLMTWLIFALYKVWKKEAYWSVAVFLVVGLMLHVHITVLLFVPALIAIFLKSRRAILARYIKASVLVLLICVAPLIVHEFRDGFQNTSSLFYFLNQDTASPGLAVFLLRISDVFFIFEALVHIPLVRAASFLVPFFFFILSRKYHTPSTTFLRTITLWSLLGTWGFVIFYTNTLFEYYFLFLAPVAYFVFSWMLHTLFKNRYLLVKILTGIAVVGWVIANISSTAAIAPFSGLADHRAKALDAIDRGEEISFNEGDIESYLYWYYDQKSH